MAAEDRPAVLLVDDRPENLVALEAVLTPLDVTILQAGSGDDALRHLLTTDVSVSLLDVQMPDIDVFETAARIKQRERTRDTPIMVLTAANLTEADRRQLNGRVSQILSRGSVATSDIVGLLKRAVTNGDGAK